MTRSAPVVYLLSLLFLLLSTSKSFVVSPAIQRGSSSTSTLHLSLSEGQKAASYDVLDGGIADIKNEEQYRAFLSSHPSSLVIMKFYAPWCRACKGLAPKFAKISKDTGATHPDVVFAQFDVQGNKEFVKSLGILALPNVHFYGATEVVESFPCGPSKVPILRRKLAEYLADRLEGGKFVRREAEVGDGEESEPCAERDTIISEETREMLKSNVYFRDLPDADFETLLSLATMSSFEPGSVIMRQGFEGSKFYVIGTGEVEVMARTGYEDPLTTNGDYMGNVINRLGVGNFFGERSLITGEPRAASIRAVKGDETTRCFTFRQEDIPASCVLSGKGLGRVEKEVFEEVDAKYGAEDFGKSEQVKSAALGSQTRGSANAPMTDLEKGIEILPLLQKFKLVRMAARCFEHIVRTNPNWGDKSELYRRSLLVSQLTETQKLEFKECFDIIDNFADGDDTISLLDLKRTMESIGAEKSEDELSDMINKANPLIDGNEVLRWDEFLGMMAEAEFYYLFVDTFNALDKYNSGFIRAGDLQQVLKGMGGVVMGSDEKLSVVKVDDDDMLIDYEQFSRMLIGAS